MKTRLLLIAIFLAAFIAGSAYHAPTADAYSCPTMDLSVLAWNTGNDWVNTSWSVKCGDANASGYYIEVGLQFKAVSDGQWHLADCQTGSCNTRKPGTGNWPTPTAHSGQSQWNVTNPASISGKPLREIVQVFYSNGDHLGPYYSSAVTP